MQEVAPSAVSTADAIDMMIWVINLIVSFLVIRTSFLNHRRWDFHRCRHHRLRCYFEAGYNGFRLKNMKVDFASNGVLAEGNVSHSKKAMDWDCSFSFTDVDKMSDLKVKPKMKLKLGNLFKSKEAVAAKEKEDQAKKPKKDNVFTRLFKKKDKNDSSKK